MTVQELLTAAYAKSKKNQPGRIATESTELVAVVNRVIRMYFQIAARVNPYFFAKSASVAFASTGWPRPSDAEAVLRITNPSAVEVVVVPIEDPTAESGLPAVYRISQEYRTAGNASDPTSGNLTFLYSKRPTDLTATTDTIDTLWPTAYAELAALEVATYLAVKDGREGEVPYLAGERDRWLVMFLAFLEHETMNERRRYDQRFNVPSAGPLMSMLAGGTGVAIP